MFSKKIKVSEAVRGILDAMVQRQGNVELTAEEAQNMYGGSFPCLVKDLSDVELLQVALLEAYVIMELKTKREAVKINRRARRNRKGGKVRGVSIHQAEPEDSVDLA